YLSPITEIIFNKGDENLYEYIDDEGSMVEPKYYVPIIPMVLINGVRGIGTGWSVEIPNYNPTDIVANIKKYLNGESMVEMIPWYRVFTGTIFKIGNQQYKVTGVYQRLSPTTIEITEIPIGNPKFEKSYKKYKNFIESMIISEGENDPDKK